MGVGGIFTGLNQVKCVKLPGNAKQAQIQERNVQHQVESIKRRNSDECKRTGMTATGKTVIPAARYGSTIMEKRQTPADERPTFYIPGHAAILILE